jgi:predicted metal-dependent hydrolase
MNTERSKIHVAGLEIEIVRKAIKNLHIAVYPPDGHIRVATPLSLDNEAVRLAVIDRLRWIRRQREAMIAQPRESEREMVTGESHYFMGRRYRLTVLERPGTARVELKGTRRLCLYVPPGTEATKRREILERWYRKELKKLIPDLIGKWESILGVEVASWGVKKMKTKWGSCTPEAKRIWLNLELAKKPARALEYVVVHEMLHLRVPTHSEEFVALMDRYIPNWRVIRAELNERPIGA